MANTTVPSALVKKAWAKATWKAAMNNIFFNKFTGTGAESIVQVLTDLSKENSGDTITVPLLMRLTGAGITGDSTLEGNEEALVYKDFAVTINQYRNAVRLNGRFEEKKTELKLRQDAKSALETWLTEKIDGMIFDALTTSPTTNRIIYAGSATSEATIASTDVFSTKEIGKAKRLAQTAQYARIRPVNVEGGRYYVMIVDPWQARDLKSDTKWLAAQQNANIRGLKNPIFTGALGLYDGVVIHENDQIKRETPSGGSVKIGRSLFLGAQACAFAQGSEARWDEKAFDYDNQAGFAIGRIFGIAKTKFKLDGTNNEDFGCIQVVSASVDD